LGFRLQNKNISNPFAYLFGLHTIYNGVQSRGHKQIYGKQEDMGIR
jgi:hypothetical protein